MDPQQRLLLEHAYMALHSASEAGWRGSWGGSDGGVFLGIERPDWALAQPASARSSVYGVTGDNVSVAAGRLSFVLGMQGPCSTFDTACSSALAALHNGASRRAQWRVRIMPSPKLSASSCALYGLEALRLQGCCRSTGVARRWTHVRTAMRSEGRELGGGAH